MSDWRQFDDMTHAELVVEAEHVVRGIRLRLMAMLVLIAIALINNWLADDLDVWATSRAGETHPLNLGRR